MELNLQMTSADQEPTGIQIADDVFAQVFNEPLVHQVVTAYQAVGRAGTRAQKNRSQARGGGRKPWRQKGTGRARVGTIRSPLWRGGGVTFAARNQDHSQKVNRKMYRAAMRVILSELIRQDRLMLVDAFSVEAPKTKALSQKIQALGLSSDVLIVLDQPDENLQLAVRNLPTVDFSLAGKVDPVSLIAFAKVLMTVPAIRQLEERLA